MADKSERIATDRTPDPGDIERTPAGERASKMPSIPGMGVDPKKMVGFAAAAGAVMFTVLALGSGLTGKNGAVPVKPKPALAAAQYDPASVIAPTLASAASDPNAPIALPATQVPAITAQAPPSPTQQPRQPSEAQVLREAARRSGLMAYGSEGGASASQRSGGYGVQDGNGSINGPASAHEPTELDSLRRASAIGEVQARALPDRNFLITAGSFIPCVLQTAMDSSQPGLVSCIIPRNIYSDNGRVVLMEKGTRVLGEYQGGLNRGQYRLFVLWNRAVTPRGIAIDMRSPATDALGRSGMDGRVNNFFWQRFGTALLFSLVEDAASVGAEAVGNSASNTTRVPSDAASTILQQNAQIKPVLRKNQGEDVGITVAQDFDFSSVYGLALK
jgi:type IV secretion system protein VirB10